MEMVRALVRGEVGRIEAVVYGILFFLFLLSSFRGGYLPTFSFSWGETAMGIVSFATLILYFVEPTFFAWNKMPKRVYVKYFLALNTPITFLTIFAGIAVEIFYVAIYGTWEVMQISITHFFLMATVFLAQGVAMAYFVKQSVHLRAEPVASREQKITTVSNLFNPLKAVVDYRAGLISPKEVFVRKCILWILPLMYIPAFFFPSNYPYYDIFSSVIFLVLYFGIPFFINKRIDNKDFYTRIAILNAPIFIDMIIIVFALVFVLGFLVTALGLPVMTEATLEVVAILFDAVLSVASVLIMVILFKKY